MFCLFKKDVPSVSVAETDILFFLLRDYCVVLHLLKFRFLLINVLEEMPIGCIISVQRSLLLYFLC